MKKGQSLLEYFLLFAILAVLAWIFLQRAPEFFKGYVTKATNTMAPPEAGQ